MENTTRPRCVVYCGRRVISPRVDLRATTTQHEDGWEMLEVETPRTTRKILLNTLYTFRNWCAGACYVESLVRYEVFS